ncbi:phospho-N-acetylmuramoyl-pentapeptide- transferase [Psychromonas sp. CNPT3]|uniref:DUF3261 domain-containing protein n=1 Tax=Psychromonas sp. CNPT3 TaxID=314282 RepID=UPI00006E791F|nr:DUF3261 domain-containing protein [Psychromonas sp. CNPT3]AGH79957.1 phospho-N-acetylmuramoyl-pentapeptide- transferase [Psychromonas sp. CNPT3]
MKRHYKKDYKKLILLSCLFLLNACALQPQSQLVQVAIDKNVYVSLPQPKQLGRHINVSQLISAQWDDKKTRDLLVQLEVDEQHVVLAGFSAWGVKLLSLTYSGDKIDSYVLTGLASTLPAPENILFNVMLSIWPVEAWQAPLSRIGWTLKEKGLQRYLYDAQGKTVIRIDYQRKPYLQGKIVFRDLRTNYSISIETN